MATYKQLRDKVLSWLDETSNTTATYTNVNNALNMTHRQRCTEQPWSFLLWRKTETLTLVAGQRRYVLHPMTGQVLYMRNTTKDYFLVETPWRQIEATGVDWNDDTDGFRYMFVEPSPVAVQPSVGSKVSIISSSASDTGATKAITIQGVVGGVLLSESITPNGVTGVDSVNTYDANGILSVIKGAAWAGTATITAGATTLLTLTTGELSRSYPQVELFWTPGDADSIEYRFYRKLRDLGVDNDIPDLPEEFHDLLVYDTLLLMAAYDDNISQARLAIWTDQREKLITSMQQRYLEGRGVAAEPRYVRDLDYPLNPFPRVND